MTDLTQAQLDYVKQQVSAAGGTKYKFVAAVSANADKALAIATLFPDGAWHTASVSVKDNSNWLNNEEQFGAVVASAIKALGRP